MTPPHGASLRKGRCSIGNGVHLVTAVTRERRPYFADFCRARTVIKAMANLADRGKVTSLAFVLMPDHLHWLMALGEAVELSEVMKSVKGYTAYKINADSRCDMTKPPGSIWQEGFHDHALRREEEIRDVARYLVMNPVRAGLVKSVWDYPHWDAVWVE